MKRVRETQTIVVRSARRPVEKKVITIAQTVSNTQTSTTIFTSGDALTYSGGVLQLSYTPERNLAANVTTFWALVYLQESRSASTLSIANGNDLYLPEQDVLACGSFSSNDTTAAVDVPPSQYQPPMKLKSQRKMKEGDALAFIVLSNTANSGVLTGTMTAFFKQ